MPKFSNVKFKFSAELGNDNMWWSIEFKRRSNRYASHACRTR